MAAANWRPGQKLLRRSYALTTRGARYWLRGKRRPALLKAAPARPSR